MERYYHSILLLAAIGGLVLFELRRARQASRFSGQDPVFRKPKSTQVWAGMTAPDGCQAAPGLCDHGIGDDCGGGD